MKILFICDDDRFYAPLSKGYFNKLNITDAEAVSSGINAIDNQGAADNAIELAESEGFSIKEHKTSSLSKELVNTADFVIVMTEEQQLAVCMYYPESLPKMFVMSDLLKNEASLELQDKPSLEQFAAYKLGIDKFVDIMLKD